jgi:hypothetical protein
LYKLITGLGKQDAKVPESGTATPTDAETETELEEEGSVDDLISLKSLRTVPKGATRRASSVSIRQAKRDALRELPEGAKPREHSEKGSVKGNVYRQYISAASMVGVISFLVLMSLAQSLSILDSYVLRCWARTNSDMGETSQIGLYLVLYGVIGVSSSAFNVASQIVLKLYCGLRSSRKLHDDSFSALMRSPLSFFELTPTGRILNLFSRDIYVVDEVLINALSSFVRTVSASNTSWLSNLFAGDANGGCGGRYRYRRAARLAGVHSSRPRLPHGHEVGELMARFRQVFAEMKGTTLHRLANSRGSTRYRGRPSSHSSAKHLRGFP